MCRFLPYWRREVVTLYRNSPVTNRAMLRFLHRGAYVYCSEGGDVHAIGAGIRAVISRALADVVSHGVQPARQPRRRRGCSANDIPAVARNGVPTGFQKNVKGYLYRAAVNASLDAI